ncbi:MAG: exopolysaccharide biosynthesis polyprenyl glycosylphosphotransferase [Opitutaceae bacterium]|jgi:exopolysaccharide biosynthesis polyprenyl glycosylphosphotransferase
MNVRRLISLALVVFDAVALLLLFNLFAYLRGVYWWPDYQLWALLPPWLFLFASLALIDGYSPRTDLLSLDYTSQHLIAVFAAMLATLLLTFVVFPNELPLQNSRGVIVLSMLFLIPLTLWPRRWVRIHYHARQKEHTLIFIGDEKSCLLFAEECAHHKVTQPIVLCPPSSMDRSLFAAISLRVRQASMDEMMEELSSDRLVAEAVILRETAQSVPSRHIPQLMNMYVDGVPIFTLERFHQVYWQTIPLYRLNQIWLFQEGFLIARDPVFERIKQIIDIILSALGLVLASPLLLASAIAIKLEDGGPVFFRQTRIGKGHRRFMIVKLRTMRAAAPGDALYTQQKDARVTRVGRFLRASRLDEFPQLWNVLRGDMSMIGPRAEWDRLVSDYEKQIPCYHFRHIVKPGITGWAQINYPYGANLNDTLRKLEYDLYYIRYFSFRLDAAIVLKTIHVMLFGRGQ